MEKEHTTRDLPNPVFSLEAEGNGFIVKSNATLGHFDNFQEIAEYIDVEVYDNVADVAKLNTLIAIVGMAQATSILLTIEDRTEGTAALVGLIAVIMMVVRRATLKPNLQKRENSWIRAINFENYVSTLQPEPQLSKPNISALSE